MLRHAACGCMDRVLYGGDVMAKREKTPVPEAIKAILAHFPFQPSIITHVDLPAVMFHYETTPKGDYRLIYSTGFIDRLTS